MILTVPNSANLELPGGAQRVPVRSVPCMNFAVCQPPVFTCGAPDLHRCSARVGAAC